MWAMELALRLNAHGVASAHYFAIQGVMNHGTLDMGGARRPSWYAFTMLARLSGNLVPVSTNDGDVWSHGARDGNRLDVVLINKATRPKDLPVTVPGFKLESGEYFDESVTSEEKPPGSIAPAAAVKLPARSVVHLVYARE
jgi:hypothetical protein